MASSKMEDAQDDGVMSTDPVAVDTDHCHGNRRQVMAEKSLHLMLHQTEMELRRALVTNQQLQHAYNKSEARYTNMVRQRISSFPVRKIQLPASTQTGEYEEPMNTQIDELTSSRTGVPISEEARGQEDTTELVDPALNFSPADLEEDGCFNPVQQASSRFQQFEPRIQNPLKGEVTDSGFPSISDPVTSTIASEPKKTMKLTAASSSNAVVAPTCVSNTQQTQTESLGPGTSQHLLDKISDENVRLRQTLTDVLNSRGLTMESYWQQRLHQDLGSTEVLRSKVVRQERELVQLKTRLLADPETLSLRCQKLENELHSRNVAIVTRDALLETFQKELNLLQQQQQLEPEGSVSSPHSVREQTDASDMASVEQSLVHQQLQEYESKLHESMKQNSELQQQLQELEQKYNKALAQQHSASDLASLQAENTRLKAEMKDMEDLTQQQMQMYEDDFKREKEERKRDKENMEAEMRNLKKIETEKQQLHAQVKILELKLGTAEKNMLTQRSVPDVPWSKELTPIVVADGGPDSCHLPLPDKQRGLPTADELAMEKKLSTQNLIMTGETHSFGELCCDKCFRTFKPGEENKLERHQAKCIDDDE